MSSMSDYIVSEVTIDTITELQNATVPGFLDLLLDVCKPLTLILQDTKTFPKCYVGRNGKQNQQNYTFKCEDYSRHHRIKGA